MSDAAGGGSGDPDPANSDLKLLVQSLGNREHWSELGQFLKWMGVGAVDGTTQFGMTLLKGLVVGGAGQMAAEAGEDPLLAMNEARKGADGMWDGKILPRTTIDQQLASQIGEAWSPLAWAGALRLGQLGAGLVLADPLVSVRTPATAEELLGMMNGRTGVTARFAAGDELRYLDAVGAEGSHMLLEGGRSEILLRPDSSRWGAFHEWMHRSLQLEYGGPRPGEDLFIERFLERHQRLLQIQKPGGTR